MLIWIKKISIPSKMIKPIIVKLKKALITRLIKVRKYIFSQSTITILGVVEYGGKNARVEDLMNLLNHMYYETIFLLCFLD